MKKDKLIVVKHNDIIEACFSLSISEQRILLSCIAQIDATGVLPEDNSFQVKVSQIEDLAQIKNGYGEIKAAADTLMKRQIKIKHSDPDSTKYKKKQWVSECEYHPSEGLVILTFDRSITPYLSELSQNFTQYKLRNVARMKSIYGVRLYELICQWQSVGEKEVSVDWLKNHWLLTDRYTRISDLKKWVIFPALKDINTHSNLWVKFGQRKRGRTITHFQFQFGLKESDQPKKKNGSQNKKSTPQPAPAKPAPRS